MESKTMMQQDVVVTDNQSRTVMIPKDRKDLEIPRAVFHIIAANSAMAYYWFSGLTGAFILLIVGALIVGLDVARVYGSRAGHIIPGFVLRLVRPKETGRISAITHFVMAATLIDILHIFAGMPLDPVLLAVMFLSFGDPMARLVGMSVSTPRLPGSTKTLGGSLTLLLLGGAMSWAIGSLLGAQVSLPVIILGGLIITGIEAYSKGWDNFTIPFIGSLIMWGLMYVGM